MDDPAKTQSKIIDVLLAGLETILKLHVVYHTDIALEVFERLTKSVVPDDGEAADAYMLMFAEWYLCHFRPNGRDIGIRFVLDQGFFEPGSEEEAVAEAMAETCAWRSYDVVAVRSDGRGVLEDAHTGRQVPFFSLALPDFAPDCGCARVSMFTAEIGGVWYQVGATVFSVAGKDPTIPLPLLGIEEFFVRALDSEHEYDWPDWPDAPWGRPGDSI